MYWRRKLTRLELALYAGLVGVALAVFLDRMLETVELAERSAMELTLSRLNAAVNVRLALDRLGGVEGSIRSDPGRNPVELARLPMTNFHGELDSSRLEELERGFWVFDRTRRELIYLPRLHRRLEVPGGGAAIRFRGVILPNDTFMLVPTHQYLWPKAFQGDSQLLAQLHCFS